VCFCEHCHEPSGWLRPADFEKLTVLLISEKWLRSVELVVYVQTKLSAYFLFMRLNSYELLSILINLKLHKQINRLTPLYERLINDKRDKYEV
jgi:hypothetical protein